jgi:hypothetical protein
MKKAQAETLYQSYDFILRDSLRLFSPPQKQAVDSALERFGIVPPSSNRVDEYTELISWPGMSVFLRSLGCLDVETRQLSLHVKDTFLDALRRQSPQVAEDLSSAAPCRSPFWSDVDTAAIPSRCVTELEVCSGRDLPPTCPWSECVLLSSHPLRDFLHLLGQALLLRSSLRSTPNGAISDTEKSVLLEYVISMVRCLRYAWRCRDRDDCSTEEYVTDASLKYRRVVPLVGRLADVTTDEVVLYFEELPSQVAYFPLGAAPSAVMRLTSRPMDAEGQVILNGYLSGIPSHSESLKVVMYQLPSHVH